MTKLFLVIIIFTKIITDKMKEKKLFMQRHFSLQTGVSTDPDKRFILKGF